MDKCSPTHTFVQGDVVDVLYGETKNIGVLLMTSSHLIVYYNITIVKEERNKVLLVLS